MVKSKVHKNVQALRQRLRDVRAERGPAFTTVQVIAGGAELQARNDDVMRAFGNAVHLSDSYLSYLLLYRLITDPDITIADYDAVIARAEETRKLDKEKKAERRSSVGDAVVMSADDINLPYGADYHSQVRKREMTLAERTRLAQEEAGYAVGRPAPTLPAPHVSDAGTVRHFGPAGAGGGGGGPGGGADDAGGEGEMSGSGIPRSRGDQWHMGQNRRYM